MMELQTDTPSEKHRRCCWAFWLLQGTYDLQRNIYCTV